MFDAVTEPVASLQPEPARVLPERIGKVLGLLSTFLAYGRMLAADLVRHADDPHTLPDFASLTRIFRSNDFILILCRVARGLARAEALETRLRRLAARGRDIKPPPVRTPSPRKPRAKPDTSPAELPSPTPPTFADVIAKDCRRPIGVVLVGICLDLGIVPGQLDRATWDELLRHVIGYCGSLANLVLRRGADPIDTTPAGRKSEAHSATADTPSPTSSSSSSNPIPMAGRPVFPEWPAPPPKSPAPAGTGPP